MKNGRGGTKASTASPFPGFSPDTCRGQLWDHLLHLLGEEGVLTSPEDLICYSYDAGVDRAIPDLVLLPRTTEQVARAIKLLGKAGLPVIARGAGTGLSGGAIPVRGGAIICLSRMNQILSIDPVNRRAVVQAGVVNSDLQQALAPLSFFYGPDPSSQAASTLGGNAAENAGGPHCLKYGYTINHVTGIVVVLWNGEVVELGGLAPDPPGYDLAALMVGSEGTLGLIAELTLNILPQPEAVETILASFPSTREAAASVVDILASGLIPAAMELMDRVITAVVEQATGAGYPSDAGAVLIVEMDGVAEALGPQEETVRGVCVKNGAITLRAARTPEEREKLWAGRKKIAASVGRFGPDQITHDGSVPISAIPGVLAEIEAIARRHQLFLGTVMHAGDGNFHPLLLFDARDPARLNAARLAGAEILEACVKAGGTISGEHGIGLEKQEFMGLMFSAEELSVMTAVRQAFDPIGLFNPGKIFPSTVGGV